MDSLSLLISLAHIFLFISFLRSRKPAEKNILNRQFLFNFYLKIFLMLRVYVSTVYTFTFTTLGEKTSPITHPSSLLINYLGIRTSGIIQTASYVLISVSRMVLIVFPTTFHNLNTTLWAGMTYVSICILFLGDLSMQLVVYNPNKCQENLAGIKLHEPFFAYSEIQSCIFCTNTSQATLLTSSEIENQTLRTNMQKENTSSLAEAENNTIFYESESTDMEPCRVFPLLSIFMASLLALEILRALAGIIKHVKKNNKELNLLLRPLKLFHHKVQPLQVQPSGVHGQNPIQMNSVKRGRGGSLPNNSILPDGKRIFQQAEVGHQLLFKKQTASASKKNDESIIRYLQKMFARNVLLH